METVLGDKPMSEDPLWPSVLQTFATRAGAELEREQANERLRQALSEVERLKNQLQAENIYLQEEIKGEHNFAEMVGNSAALVALLRRRRQRRPVACAVRRAGPVLRTRRETAC